MSEQEMQSRMESAERWQQELCHYYEESDKLFRGKILKFLHEIECWNTHNSPDYDMPSDLLEKLHDLQIECQHSGGNK